MLAAHPTENDWAAPWAKCYAYRFYAPNFEPMIANQDEIVSIGSGKKVDRYIKALSRLSNDMELFQFEVNAEGGAAFVLMDQITSELQRNPEPGISNHLHICVVSRNGIKMGKNNVRKEENPKSRIPMPPVATSMEELDDILFDISGSLIEKARC